MTTVGGGGAGATIGGAGAGAETGSATTGVIVKVGAETSEVETVVVVGGTLDGASMADDETVVAVVDKTGG